MRKIDIQPKAAIYVRVSTLFQADKDSLPMQKEDLINYARYALSIENYEIFEDPGFSGKNTNRPGYQKMLLRLRTGEFSHVLVWKIDRISRDLLDFSEMYKELRKLGVSFVSKNEQFDTSTAIGEAMLKIIMVFAELERKMTSERVTATMLSRAAKGIWNGGPVPYGYHYCKETQTFSLIENECKVIKYMRAQYVQSKSLVRVSQDLNDKNFVTRRGKEWSPTTVHIILTNPWYTGTYRYNYWNESEGPRDWTVKPEDEWIVNFNHHPALFTLDEYLEVQGLLESNRRSNKESFKTYSRKNVHIFAGLLYCGVCGSGMQSNIDRERKKISKGYRPSIYMCSSRRIAKECTNKYISDVKLGPFILNYIHNIKKAQNNFGKTTTLEMLQKKLLRGKIFEDVIGIEEDGIMTTYRMLQAGNMPLDVILPPTNENDSEGPTEVDILEAEKRKHERALIRLKNLYLYGDSDLPEKDYIIERKNLMDEIDKLENRLSEIAKSKATSSISDEDFTEMASYYILAQKLEGKRFVNFFTLIQDVENQVVKTFMNSIIKKIVITDGKVESIQFKNGLTHKFLYAS